MQIVKSLADPSVVAALRRGGIVVARTDTIYGILASADDEGAVRRVYTLKHRSEAKSPIVLIQNTIQLYDTPSPAIAEVCRSHWPGKTSIILPSTKAPEWIRRENHSVAYRIPDHPELQQLIAATGPLIAPSANHEDAVPATSVAQAVEYFGDAVDIYVDGGQVTDNTPSQLLRVDVDGKVERLR